MIFKGILRVLRIGGKIMQLTSHIRRKIFKYAGFLGVFGFLGLIEPTGYSFFIFFTFFLYSDECMEPDVKDEVYERNSARAYKITAIMTAIFFVYICCTYGRGKELYLYRQVF